MNKQEKLEFLKQITQDFYQLRMIRRDPDDPVQRPNKEGEGWEVFSGVKPSGYYVPMMVFSTKEALKDKGPEMAWFVEIWMERICIFRTSSLPYGDKKLEDLEEEALDKVIRDVCMYGLGSAWKFLKDLEFHL